MSNFGNIFYWDLKNNERISLSELDDIKTNRIVRCRIKEDRINIEPLDETDSNFNENKVWKILDVIKDDYKKVVEFLVKFKVSNDWSWHRFYKKSNGDIEMVFQEDDDMEDSENPQLIEPIETTQTDISGEETQKNDSNNKTQNIDTIKIDDSDFINGKNESKIKTEQPKKTNDRLDIKKISQWIKTKLKFNKNEYENVINIKTDISTFSNEENDDYIKNNMEDIDKGYINAEIELDKARSSYGKIIHRQGMGDVLTAQSVVDNKVRSVEETYKEICSNLDKLKNNSNIKSNEYLVKMCDIYKKFMEWIKNSDDTNINGSEEYRGAMTSYFPEIIAPFVFLYEKNLKGNSQASIELLKKKIGTSNLLGANPFISYPQSTTQMLFDSVLYFGNKSDFNDNDVFKCLRISVKGGKNGLGAKASISGLKSYFYDKNNLSLPENFLTSRRFFDASLYTEYYRPYIKKFAMEESDIVIKILSILMLSRASEYKQIIEIFCEILNIKYQNTTEMFNKFQNYLNTNKQFENCVLVALQYASYDFAQLNCKEVPNNGDFHYDFTIQYPAIFKGNINFELITGDKPHKLTFHIVGENLPKNITQYD